MNCQSASPPLPFPLSLRVFPLELLKEKKLPISARAGMHMQICMAWCICVNVRHRTGLASSNTLRVLAIATGPVDPLVWDRPTDFLTSCRCPKLLISRNTIRETKQSVLGSFQKAE